MMSNQFVQDDQINDQSWLDKTISQLKERNFEALDIDLLIEEIGGNLKDALENNLIV
ncbi:DUF29 family protein [Anabaena sp. FACHB-1237]|uniref:DUF29 family protein n=1 Tax=Anabaena sp. FACHB-1237 TaxID=2692769 RepID=UPI0024110D5A|nr:DUF29 family protein [Anabaena sp. FACHB-1237]